MTPYEIMLSESQERMCWSLRKAASEVFRVFEKWGLDAVEVGRVTRDAKMRVLQHGEVVAEIPTRRSRTTRRSISVRLRAGNRR